MARRVAALAAVSLSLGSVAGFAPPIGTPMSLRAGSSAVSLFQPAAARFIQPAPCVPHARRMATHSTFRMATGVVPITVTGNNIEVSAKDPSWCTSALIREACDTEDPQVASRPRRLVLSLHIRDSISRVGDLPTLRS